MSIIRSPEYYEIQEFIKRGEYRTDNDYIEAAARERTAFRLVEVLAKSIAEAAEPIWRIGDGYGGWVHETLSAAFHAQGLRTEPSPQPKFKPLKEPIKPALRRQVFERDAYRCQTCGGHQDLSVDHIIPESKGGTTELENLQTLCRPCNSRKGVRL